MSERAACLSGTLRLGALLRLVLAAAFEVRSPRVARTAQSEGEWPSGLVLDVPREPAREGQTDLLAPLRPRRAKVGVPCGLRREDSCEFV